MINVLLPMGGLSNLFDARLYPYPVPLIEVLGKPMIERPWLKEVKFAAPAAVVGGPPIERVPVAPVHLELVPLRLAEEAPPRAPA